MKELSLNILDIAQNSLRAGAAHVEIALADRADGLRALTVTDDGSGMDAALLSRVTDPFSTTRTTRPVGLGLPLLKLAAEQTGGTLTVESRTAADARPGEAFAAGQAGVGEDAGVDALEGFGEVGGVELGGHEAGEVANPDEELAQKEQRAAQTYGSTNLGQYTDPQNPLNRFVAYHLLDGAMAYNKLVMHMNEFGYDPGTNSFDPQLTRLSVDVWDYYTTMGQTRCLLKVTQNGDLEDGVYPIYLNTAREYNDGRDGDYKVVSITRRGQKISPTNGTHGINSAVNGFYYPIDGILLYDDEVKNTALRGRLRFDIATLTPELWSTNLRGRSRSYFTNEYFKNIINVAEDSKIFYLKNPWTTSTWYDYQGDEWMLQGIFDATFRLPPVPVAGTYELRMGISTNDLRGMAQIYFGENPDNLPPTGLPIDLRVNPTGFAGFTNYKETHPEIYAVIPWELDTDDEDQNRTIEKNLRNAGYLKGPQYYDGCGTSTPARGNYGCLRRIITAQYMEPGKTYYVRYKTALEATDGQFFMDYFELCPSYVYNGVEPEDIW